jgi:non-specific serine/threonine protein kinase/serine/threonine-protein kinase
MTPNTCISDDALAAWSDGRLSQDQVAVMASHLAGCTTCRVVLAELARTTEPRPQAGTLGRYLLQEKVGAGGMGTVYAAWDPKLGRKVAVKILHEAHRDVAARAQRFIHEREILAGLEHPNIGHLLDAGETAEGRPYFVMEYVDGHPIDQFCDRQKLPVRARLELMLPVFAAVTHAHQHLVVHRDLKPGNILVTAAGVVKLVDFGIARLLEEDARLTLTGTAPMTPAFASPEQARRDPVATSSDVYSLGVVMHELLAGVGPYAVPANDVEALLRAIQAGELPSCSLAVSRAPDSAVAARASSRDRLRRELEGDVEAVVSMALRKEPKDRYASVQALEDDVRAWLEGRPTAARRSSTLYRAVKLMRRHKTSVAALVATFLALAVGLVATLWQAQRAEHQRDVAQRRFGEVRTLAHAVLFDYHDGIAQLPGSTPMRERMVKDALVYLDSLAADAQDDPSLRSDLAQAYLKIGDVQGDPYGASLGDTTHAKQSYEKGREIAQSVLRDVPKDWTARKVMASSHDKLGAILEVTGQLRDALAEYEQALAKDEALSAERPEDLDQRFTVGRDYLSIGQVTTQLGDLDGAAAKLGQALAVRTQLLVKRNDPTTRRGVAVVHLSLGDVLKEQGKVKDAIAHAEEAERIATALLVEQPDSPDFRRVLGTAWSRLVILCLLDGQRARALEIAQRPLTQARKELALDPQNSVARRDLVVALSGLASAQQSADLDDAAVASLHEALEVQRALRAEDPTNLQARRDLCQLLTAASLADLAQKDWSAAETGFRTLLEEATTLLPLDPENSTVLEARNDALNGIAQALAGKKRFDEAVAESRIALAGMDELLKLDPAMGRLRNRRAIWVALEAGFRLDQAIAKPSKQAWKAAQEALQSAMAGFDALKKEGVFVGAADEALGKTVDGLARCAKELGR